MFKQVKPGGRVYWFTLISFHNSELIINVADRTYNRLVAFLTGAVFSHLFLQKISDHCIGTNPVN